MLKRAISLLLTVALAASAIGAAPVFATGSTGSTQTSSATEAEEVKNENSSSVKEEELQNQLSQLEQNYKDLTERQAAIKAVIANASSLKNQQITARNNIDEQIAITESQIELLETKMALLEESIALLEENIEKNEQQIAEVTQRIEEKEADIIAKQEEYDQVYANFRQRLRALYIQGNKTDLELLFSAESYTDMLVAMESRKRIAKYDTNQMEELILQKQELEDALVDIQQDRNDLQEARDLLERNRAKQEKNKETLAESRTEIEDMRAELDEQRSTADALAQNYAAQEQEANQQQAEILAAMQTAKAQMDDIFSELAQMSQMEEYVGGEFQWPLPGYSTITSTFGETRSYYSGGQLVNDVHTGTDISGSGVYGKPIVAANSGVVYSVVYSNYGYGNYVIIDHGGGYSTLYAHCSSLAVQEGQVVIRGDVIAYVGSTGNSTGPHLHFEVRINGKAVNAMQYFQKV